MTKNQIASYRFTKQAQKDIQRLIEQGREQFGIKQVISYFDELEKVFALLAENPNIARLRNELNPPVRVHPFKSLVIVFEETGSAEILILTLRHARENWLEQ